MEDQNNYKSKKTYKLVTLVDGKITTETINDDKCVVKEKSKCNECAKAYANKCPKIGFDGTVKIDQFDFIKEAKQLYKEDNQLYRFVITKCLNYQMETRGTVTLTAQEKMDLIKKKDLFITGLMDYYEINDWESVCKEMDKKPILDTDPRGASYKENLTENQPINTPFIRRRNRRNKK